MARTDAVERIIDAFWTATKDCGPAEVAPAMIYLAAEYIARWPEQVQETKRAEFDALVSLAVARINREVGEYNKLIGAGDDGA
jgi:hypothetical protein